ncbi:hypothetical protein KH990_06785 [Methanoculleus bourgensis]|mgnify:CR=1 FL=1|jgi:hypothetical protein|uniref:Uncharacterized protein n=1 Tax=Methanoculleus bourgensis TaxID=83986 RepID=A0A0X3BK06_9EURY|nr:MULTISPECIES: hypothetical protein [Methanoculleus]MBT0733074.1 hypothetical protein [Methanoculleus bourgensis]MDD3373142.1 hypothetical protein [Methanoculleus bourgensis]NMA87920.1 hypothetical protein [Methanoculleus bourgensis]NQS77540.1 hypothetical protein [Methanoculleus bourgensis]CVK32220.1 conserved protein of unknown function [Methanoculleus bourgensis]
MANNPYDEMFKNIARLMEKILSEMPLHDPRIIGFTIISGPPDAAPYFDPSGEDGDEETEFEVIEGDDCIYITAAVNARAEGAPYVTFQNESVTLCTGGDEETVIDLDCEIDVPHSFYNVQHGVIDAVCRKKNAPDGIARS